MPVGTRGDDASPGRDATTMFPALRAPVGPGHPAPVTDAEPTDADDLLTVRTRPPVVLRAPRWIAHQVRLAMSAERIADRLRSVTRHTSAIVRLTVAAVLTFVLGQWLLHSAPLTGALTALLVVQATLYSTMSAGIRRVGAVLVGVFIALAVSTVVGLTWWSLAIVVAAGLVLGRLLPFKDQDIEVAISALLILGVTSTEVAAQTRVVETLLGALVGVAVTLAAPPRVQTPAASDAVALVARKTSQSLDRAAETLAGAVRPSDLASWAHGMRSVSELAIDAETAIDDLSRSRRLNPRAAGTPDAGPPLRAGLSSLEHVVVAVRALYVAMADGVPELRRAPSAEPTPESRIRSSVAVTLIAMADTVTAFSRLVQAEAAYESRMAEVTYAHTVDRLREAHESMSQVLVAHAHAERTTATDDDWLMKAPVIAAVDRVLRELDVDLWTRRREGWAEQSERVTPIARLLDMPLPAWMLRD